MNVNDVTATYDCKVPGCTNEARSNRGPNAYLCAEHIKRRPKAAPATNGDETVGGRIKSLAALAREVDRAKAKAKELDEKALDAKAAAHTKEQEFKRIAREVIGQDAS